MAVTAEQIEKLEEIIMYACHLCGQEGPEEQAAMNHLVDAILITLERER